LAEGFFLSGLLIGVLFFALVFDLKRAKIPNLITFPGMAIGILAHTLTGGLKGMGTSALGLLVGGGAFLPFYLLKGMGAGDIKLMAAVGALVGFPRVISAIVFTALAGGIYALVLIIFNPGLMKSFFYSVFSGLKTFLFTGQWVFLPLYQGRQKPQVRYGVAIVAGTVFSQWFLPVLNWSLI